MDILFKILLVIHILFGGMSLCFGLFVLFAKKGDKRHKLIGSFYFYSMLFAGILAIFLSYLHSSYFLFIIAVFTIYMVLSGRRYLKKKTTKDVKPFDWILTMVMLLFAVAFISLGTLSILRNNFFGIVLIVFGGLSLLFVYQDYKNFKGLSRIKNFWLIAHIQRMVGSYIATFTAFIVVNNSFLPDIIAWLLPTAVLVPFMSIWRNKYQINLEGSKNI